MYLSVLCFVSIASSFRLNTQRPSRDFHLDFETKKSSDASWDSRVVRNFYEHNNTYSLNHVFETRVVKGLHDGMKMHKLPRTDLLISELTLGTMNFGQQVSKDDAYEQLDLAINKYGINSVDSSELFPGPYMDKTLYRSERILGHWLHERKFKRSNLIISTKIEGYDWIDDFYGSGIPKINLFNKKKFIESVDKQLKRLGTDYIDILYFASPERALKIPGDHGNYRIDYENPFWNLTVTQMQLEAMNELIKSGKVRHYGLTDESAFGVTHFMTSAHYLNLPQPVAIQNSYNLLERNEFEIGLLEICQPTRCNIGLMAKSPLAGGALTGKYLDPFDIDPNARMKKFGGNWMGRYIKPSAVEATRKYKAMCQELSIPLAPMALSYVTSRDFVSSTLIGATNLNQLEDNILSLNIPMTEDLEKRINKIYEDNWDPTRGAYDYIDSNLDYTDPATLPWGSKDQDVDPELEDLLNQGERHTGRGQKAGV